VMEVCSQLYQRQRCFVTERSPLVNILADTVRNYRDAGF
jgi:hypothetical protein